MPGPLDRIRSALARRIMPSAEREALFPPVQAERPTTLMPAPQVETPPPALMPELDLGSGGVENAIEALRNAPMDRRGLMSMLRGASAAATVGRIAPLAVEAAPAAVEAVLPAAPALPTVSSLMTDLMKRAFSHYRDEGERISRMFSTDNPLSKEEWFKLDRENDDASSQYENTRNALNTIHEWADTVARARDTVRQHRELAPNTDPDQFYVRQSDPVQYVREQLARGRLELPSPLIQAIYQSGLPVDQFMTRYVEDVLGQQTTLPHKHNTALLESMEGLSNPPDHELRSLRRLGYRGSYLGLTMNNAVEAAGGARNVTPELFIEQLGKDSPYVRSMLPEGYAMNPETWKNYVDDYMMRTGTRR